MIEPDERARLHERLRTSRAGLLAALEGVTERDFTTDLGGENVVQLLARVAAEERAAIAEAEGGKIAERQAERPLPPQVIHALAGARYRTAGYLDGPNATPEVARQLVEAAERREAEAARRVRERPALPPISPAPEIPVIRSQGA